jgi:hypothetical protein
MDPLSLDNGADENIYVLINVQHSHHDGRTIYTMVQWY